MLDITSNIKVATDPFNWFWFSTLHADLDQKGISFDRKEKKELL